MPKVKKKYTLDDIISRYERRQLGIIEAVMQEIMKLFDGYANEVAFLYHQRKLINNRFLPPDVRKGIERISTTINAKSKDIIINGIKRSWLLSEEKNDAIETLVYGGRRKPPTGIQTKAPTSPGGKGKSPYTSVDAFIKRKNEGLNLSKRVFKLSNVYKKVMNETMIEGLNKGTPARLLAKQLRSNLRNNEVVQNPGRGVYRSPRKNAERLTRSEINMAYANADHVRWANQWFVIGIQVKLSNAHPKYDICDSMAGRYPKDFVFTKWHPQCLCTAIPILAPQEQRDQMIDFQLGITDKKPDIKYINTLPSSATKWMEANADRVNKWKSQPYWKTQNKSRVQEYFK